MPDRRVLVVGTTPDYVALIHERYPGRALFLTDTCQRVESLYAPPERSSEIVCDLGDVDTVLPLLLSHLSKQRQELTGVACYDCERLSLAAELAAAFGLPFPSPSAILRSRDKLLSKSVWQRHGVRCPKAELIHEESQTLGLTERLGGPVVLKPLTGSGSELTFFCRDNQGTRAAFRQITAGLEKRCESPMYRSVPTDSASTDHFPPVLAEQHIAGPEYSADFIVDNGNIEIVRVASKIRSHELPFGTTRAYVVPAELPVTVGREDLVRQLRAAAVALGLTKAVCMVDFIVNHHAVCLLELTPRIGGDCLPALIRLSSGLDTIGLALDFAEGRPSEIPAPSMWRRLVGLRLFAPHSGTLAGVSCERSKHDRRVREIYAKHHVGHRIALPPDDYDSWVLGHIVFEPHREVSVDRQCDEIAKLATINVRKDYDQKFARIHRPGRRTASAADPAA